MGKTTILDNFISDQVIIDLFTQLQKIKYCNVGLVDYIFSDLTHLWSWIKQGHGRRRKVTGVAETVSASEVGLECRGRRTTTGTRH